MYSVWSSVQSNVLTQYPRSRNAALSPLVASICRWIRTALLPLITLSKRHTVLGGMLTHRWIWSASVPHQLDSPLPAYFFYHLSTCFFTFPYSISSILGDHDILVFTFPPHVG